MIFDDDRDILDVYSLILTTQHFDVIVRSRCSAIIQDVTEHRPHAILMDNSIPDLGGIKAVQLLKSFPEFASIPMIFCSANIDVAELAAHAGAEYSLQKPFNINELEEMVSRAVSKGLAVSC